MISQVATLKSYVNSRRTPKLSLQAAFGALFMSIPPPIQRESPQEVCLLCDSTLLCVFMKKLGIIWPRTRYILRMLIL